MGGIATPELARTVAEAGGLGMVALHSFPAEEVASILDRLAATTAGAVGINFLMPFMDEAALEAAASRCRLVELFYGDPVAGLVRTDPPRGALACWQVGSADEARAAADAGCDLIVAQGTEAGGHVRGGMSLLPLLGEVLDRVGVPVLAAGGATLLARGAAPRHDRPHRPRQRSTPAKASAPSQQSSRRRTSSASCVRPRPGSSTPQDRRRDEPW